MKPKNEPPFWSRHDGPFQLSLTHRDKMGKPFTEFKEEKLLDKRVLKKAVEHFKTLTLTGIFVWSIPEQQYVYGFNGREQAIADHDRWVEWVAPVEPTVERLPSGETRTVKVQSVEVIPRTRKVTGSELSPVGGSIPKKSGRGRKPGYVMSEETKQKIKDAWAKKRKKKGKK